MNILFITVSDLVGQRFNGYLLHETVKRVGHNSAMTVLRKQSDEPDIHCLQGAAEAMLDSLMTRIEKRLSLHSMLPVTASGLYLAPYYRAADILHLQLVYAMNPFFSLFNVPIMSRSLPTVWTLHDPWLMTGHCIHPLKCERWRSGCGKCEDLRSPFPIGKDTTAFSWKVKKWIMHRSKVTLIVASHWMHDRVRQSPILSHLPCHVIPFGVDTTVFVDRSKQEARRRMGIPDDVHVLACRARKDYDHADRDYDFKGTVYLKLALQEMRLTKPTYLITFDHKGALDCLKDKYHLVELGWLEDEGRLAEAMSAADVFLMPSIAESFGMMAVESMACGTPVICFEGTALPSVINAPRSGIAVAYKDVRSFAAAIEGLLANSQLRQQLAAACIKLVRQEYNLDLYAKRHIELYQELATARN